MSDRDNGINVLRWWWGLTPMASDGSSTFGAALQQLDGENPDFVASLGKIWASSNISQSKVKAAFQDLVNQSGETIPHYTEILQALVTAAGNVSAGDIAQAAEQGVAQAGKILAFGVGTYALVAVVIGVVLLAPELKVLLKSFRSRAA